MNMLFPPLLAKIGDLPSLSEFIESTESLFVGFFFVIALLGVLSGLTSLVGLTFTRRELRALKAKQAEAEAEAARMAASPPAPATAPAAASGEAPEDPHLVPVIAAAIHAVFGDRPHRVVSIRPAASGWAQEGRREIFSGRRVR